MGASDDPYIVTDRRDADQDEVRGRGDSHRLRRHSNGRGGQVHREERFLLAGAVTLSVGVLLLLLWKRIDWETTDGDRFARQRLLAMAVAAVVLGTVILIGSVFG